MVKIVPRLSNPGDGPGLAYGRLLVDWLAVERRSRWVLAGLYLLLAVNLFALGLYLFHGYQTYFHTDSSTKNLLAQEIWETGQFFPRDWNYVNGDLMVVFGHLVIWPLLYFFKNGFALHAVAGLVFAAAILASVWKLTSLTCEHRWQRVAIVALLAGGLSWPMAENVFGQVSYGVVLLFSVLVLVSGWHAVRAGERATPLASVGLFVALFFATWSNPQRALISYALPLFVALAANGFWGGPAAETATRMRRALLVCSISGLALAGGFVCSSVVLAMVENSQGAAAARWLDFSGLVRNVVYSVNAVIALLGGLPPAGGDVVTLGGAYAALRMVVALAVLVVLPPVLARALRAQRPELRFLAVFTCTQLLLILFLFVTTTIPDMADPVNSGRYLVPSLVLALVVLFSLPLSRESLVTSAFTLCLFCVLGTNSVVRVGREALPVRAHNVARMEVLDVLRSKGLHYGYASYWNSGVYTVLSGGDQKVRQVLISNGIPMPMRHLASNRWYEAKAWTGPSFLLLDDAETAAVDWSAMKALTGTEPERVQAGSMIAFVYPMNLAEKIPLWSRSFDRPLTLPATPSSMRNQGAWDEAKSAVLSSKGQAGFLAFGPYMHLPAGRYRADFAIEASETAEGAHAAVVDIAHGGGTQVIATSGLPGPFAGTHRLEFDLAVPAEQVEVRVRATGEADVLYRGVVLHPVSEQGR